MTLHPNICVALEHPNSIVIESSQRRMELATQAEALEPALDAAVAGEARNSIEKLLLQQMATAHVLAMKCFETSMGFNLPGHGLPPVEQVRLLNAAARLIDVCQNGLLVQGIGSSEVRADPRQFTVEPLDAEGTSRGRRSTLCSRCPPSPIRHPGRLAVGSPRAQSSPLDPDPR
jgi:hypothetical protein